MVAQPCSATVLGNVGQRRRTNRGDMFGRVAQRYATSCETNHNRLRNHVGLRVNTALDGKNPRGDLGLNPGPQGW